MIRKTANKWKNLGGFILAGAGIILGIILVCNSMIINTTTDKVYSDIHKIPFNRVGLLLGTSPKMRGGRSNPYFNNRINATVALFKAGKIKRILVSGDNRRLNYNEPIEMRKALIAQGIPDSVIVLDYAGIRTLDSVIRAKKVFGQDSITVISQRFHNERAIYIANHNHMEAIGYNAGDVDAVTGFKTNVRELLARVKVFIDILTRKAPKHLGEAIQIK